VGALVVGTAVGAGVFVGARLAQADPDAPPTRNELTYSGVLPERRGMLTTLIFQFYKRGANVCGVTTGSFTPNETGAFTVPVPLGDCPDARGLFNGTDVTYNVLRGTDMLAEGVQINPVPHARFADQAGVTSDCPPEYQRITGDATVLGGAAVVLCRRRDGDEMVKVGDGASSYWIDRYEATIWASPTGGATPINSDGDALAALVPPNGQWTSAAPAGMRPRAPAFARSAAAAVRPARSVTWFQASAPCRASGKQLPSGEEWLRAAHGTPDNDDTRCYTATTNTIARDTNLGSRCYSLWGAQDMIGNVWEWTDEWYASVGQTTTVTGSMPLAPATSATAGQQVVGVRVNDTLTNSAVGGWPADYGGDATWNVTSVVQRAPGEDNKIGIPSAAIRGGDWDTGTRAGVFALYLGLGPSHQDTSLGFRCVVRRRAVPAVFRRAPDDSRALTPDDAPPPGDASLRALLPLQGA